MYIQLEVSNETICHLLCMLIKAIQRQMLKGLETILCLFNSYGSNYRKTLGKQSKYPLIDESLPNALSIPWDTAVIVIKVLQKVLKIKHKLL